MRFQVTDNFIASPQVRLNDAVLPDARWINTNTLTATLPAVSPGFYDVVVTNPGGQESALQRGLAVGKQAYLPVIFK